MIDFDFATAMKDAVAHLDDEDRAKVARAIDRLNAVIAQHERSTATRLASIAEQLAQDLEAKAASRYEAAGEGYVEELDHLRDEAAGLAHRLKGLEETTNGLQKWLHPIWGELPQKVYLGLSMLIGLVVGAGLIVFVGSLERRSAETTLVGLEMQSSVVSRNLDEFKAVAGFEFLQDGDQVVMAVAEGYKIEKYVSVRGIFGGTVANAYRVVPK